MIPSMRYRWFALLLTLVLGLLPFSASAQTCPQFRWEETRTRAFVFTYVEDDPLGPEIAAQLGEAADAAYHRFAELFGRSLPLPVTVRLYPTESDYYCFNALAPQIPIGQTHSHIGGREIALIAQNILEHPDRWQQEGLDALRGELAVLQLNLLSGDKAPEGLQLGVGIFAQDPFTTFESLLQRTSPPPNRPSESWRTLWESPSPVTDPDQVVQAASTVAYLVDVYGWARFLDFLSALRTAESWRQALEEVYPANAGALEDQWAGVYYARYIAGRWRENPFYALSLSPYAQLIESGAYQAAADGLEEIIGLLIDLEDFDRLSRAQELNALAQQGLAADAAARQARQAYLEGDFPAAQDFASQAIDAYVDLEDTRNLEALLTIQNRSNEIIELQAELDGIETELGTPAGLFLGPRLAAAGERLQVLGDPAGASRAGALIAEVNADRQVLAAGIAVLAVLVSLAMLALRISSARRPPPPEAQLQS